MRRAGRNEDGVVVVFVLVVMVVLVGMLGYVVDFGIARQERRELQNGADSAALAMAQECALGLCTNLSSKAEPYVDGNAKDGAASVTGVSVSGATVRVDVRTQTSGGATSIATKFASQFGQTSVSVTAWAKATWGAPASATTFPLTISFCEWNTIASSLVPQTIYFHDPNPKGVQIVDPPCAAGPAGQNVPGGFGWLQHDALCKTLSTAGQLVFSDPGNAPPNANNSGCLPGSFLNTPLLIPVFDGYSGTGNNATYHIKGLATLRITQMRLGAQGWTTASPPCNNPQRCIYAAFERDIIPWTGGSTIGPDLGTLAVKLIL